ncbi:hypothetical protein [Burkholderia sp. Ac-20349]|uniref:hypothetical protein n=1 Tax=Burkholderia sp. Ac-20349 TaxID=2703893 RepID=UPI00197B79C9|nr:hypothetical protein [Burkholderia sp. Ac-20349]MBN3839274.1 hypothetical protein [Burkholderia sp. Ac-20349]
MDDLDRAAELEERTRAAEIAAAIAGPKLKPVRCCHYCFETIGETLLFCDKDCRDDYERSARAARLNGR